MNEEKKYLIFMIINIIITLIIGIRTFSKMSNNGCITPQSPCANKFNCSTCENGKTVCSYMNENGEQISGLQCPCDEDDN